MPENLKRFANGHRGGLTAAIVICGVGLGLFALLAAALSLADPYELHAVKMGLIFLSAACLAGLIWALLVRSRHTVQTKFTCSLYGEQQLAAIDGEVAAGAGYYKTLGIAVTQSSLLSHGAGLVIVPLNDVANITCRTAGGAARFVLRSRSGGETMLPTFKFNQAARAEMHTLTGWLAARIPDLAVGALNTPAGGQPFDTVPGFFATDTTVGLQMQPDVLGPGGSPRAMQYGVGLLGALMGAAIGGAAWGIVGLLGYISGWIGLLVVMLALYGYKQTAGRLNRAAGAICILVSLCVIFAANYLEYAATLADALSDYYYVTTLDVLPELFPLLAELEVLGQFWMEFGIGAVLTLVFGVIAIVGLSSKKANQAAGVVAAAQVSAGAAGSIRAENMAAGSPGSFAAPNTAAYAAPNAAAPVVDHTKYEVRWPKRSSAGWVVLVICAVLITGMGVVFAMMLEDEPELRIMMLALFGGLGILYLVLAWFNYRNVHNFCITYDDRTIALTKANGKTFTCAWTEIRALHFANGVIAWGAGRLRIDAPYGKILFTTQMPGNEHLMNYARTFAVNALQQ